MANLEGRRVLVTGASAGIGAAVVRATSGTGAAVTGIARREDALRGVTDPVGAHAVVGDVTDPVAVEAAVAAAADAMGGIDALVNNAGLMRPGTIADGDPDEWRAMFDTNVLGLLAVTRATIPHLRAAGGGNVVNLGSMSGRRLKSVTSTVYSATKFAVHTISEGLRRELRPDGIRVTTIAPGFVDTGIFDGVDDVELRERMQSRQREVGLDPEVVADQVVHTLAAPPEATLVEIAMLSTLQD